MPGTVAQPRIDFLDRPLRLYIDGEFALTDERLTVLNPATGRPLAEAPLATAHEVDLAVRAARKAFPGWRFSPPTGRARLIWGLADRLAEHADELATIEVLDNGKPPRASGPGTPARTPASAGNSAKRRLSPICNPSPSGLTWRRPCRSTARASAGNQRRQQP